MKVVHLEPKVTRHDAAVGRQPSNVSRVLSLMCKIIFVVKV
ncbi:unnamed protein product [Acanthoscelides obtectus]|uniref:Uncharacterized protein n=1 Tax=Acanthoscelides obtectus TaxID=200917 RepID=A0A9P0VR91_ACAOB|nr:unnamed protein product [Acanthoscelides obtectus]CAK1642027.1 hypothetical protein AOBTE_LOCUS12800 [Acanthoscelides obtectus]